MVLRCTYGSIEPPVKAACSPCDRFPLRNFGFSQRGFKWRLCVSLNPETLICNGNLYKEPLKNSKGTPEEQKEP